MEGCEWKEVNEAAGGRGQFEIAKWLDSALMSDSHDNHMQRNNLLSRKPEIFL